MADLILMPKSRMIHSHIHMQDSSVYGAMSQAMPGAMDQVVDFSQDLSDIVKMWDDELFGHTIASPRMSFWSLDEMRQWVRDHAASDVYANQHQGSSSGLYVCSTDKATIDALGERGREYKNHRIRCRMDELLSNSVSAWIRDNCADKTEISMGWPKDGARENDYSFRSNDDATLFVVRWKGHGALEILD